MRPKSSISIEAGFTLVEIMIALVVLSIGLVALAGLQVSAIKGNAFSKRMTTAVSIANEKMEQLKNSSYASILSESSTQITTIQPSMTFTRQVTVTNNSPLPNTKTVNVTVTWSDGSKSHSVPLTTIVSQ